MTELALDEDSWTVSAILQRTVSLFRENFLRAGIALAALMALGIAADTGAAGPGLNLVITLVTVGLQYWLILTILDEYGLRQADGARFPAFFGAGILTGLGVLAGMVLLVVPGIFLLVRWSISGVAVIAGEGSVTESIGYSWRETADHFWPILLVFAAIYLPLLVGFIGLMTLPDPLLAGGPPPDWLLVVVAEFCINAAVIASWLAAVAIYMATRRGHGVSEVFA